MTRDSEDLNSGRCIYMYMYIHIYYIMYIHIHIYISIYIYIMVTEKACKRGRERWGEGGIPSTGSLGFRV